MRTFGSQKPSTTVNKKNGIAVADYHTYIIDGASSPIVKPTTWRCDNTLGLVTTKNVICYASYLDTSGGKTMIRQTWPSNDSFDNTIHHGP